jgi:hypothetical protein
MKAQIKINKAKVKNNISCSVSKYENGAKKSYNFTGSLIALEGFYSSDNICYDTELPTLKVGTTVICNNIDMGEAVYERCATIFAERANIGDLNPSVDLHLEFNTLNVKETNILISNVTKIYVESNTSLRDSSTRVNDALASLRKISSNNSQLTAARLSAASMLNSIKKTAKSYL